MNGQFDEDLIMSDKDHYELIEGIGLVESILERYSFSSDVVDRITAGITEIRNKYGDENLYLGIIGEFSSGKSTLINSLLRDDLLATSATQATTCSATYIQYLDNMAVRVKKQDGTSNELMLTADDDRSRLFSFIDRYAADEQYAAGVDRVELFCPCEGIRDKVVIIDTPGANVGNSRHAEVTGNVIKNVCDAFVVVVPADSPMSKSLKAFLTDNVGEYLYKCIFAVTKLDIYDDPGKRKRVLADISAKLSGELGVSNPKVLPMSPVLVMEKLYEDEGRYEVALAKEQKEILYAEYLESEKTIKRLLQKHRFNYQLGKIISMMENVYCEVKQTLAKLENEYEKSHRILMDNVIMDFGEFIMQQKTAIEKKLDKLYEKNNLLDRVCHTSNDVYKDIKRKIDGKLTVDDLKAYLKKSLEGDMAVIQTRVKALLSEFQSNVQEEINGRVKEFEKEFTKNYQNLATLENTITSNLESTTEMVATATINEKSVSSVYNTHNVDTIETGGMITGGIIGTVVIPVPVLGTVVGAVAGLFAGDWLINKFKLPAIKEDCNKKVLDCIQANCGETIKMLGEEIKNYISSVKKDCRGIMNAYYERYNTLLRKTVERDRIKGELLQKNRNEVRAYSEQLELWKKQYEKAREEICGSIAGSE